MPANKIALPELPTDFEKRAADTYAAMRGGADLSVAEIAVRLGLSVDFFLGCLATYQAMVLGVPAVINLGPSPTIN